MPCETGAATGASGEEIFYRIWSPDSEPRAALVLVHGLGEHSGRYEHVAEHLVARGVVVHAYDHLGHGRSGGRRGWMRGYADLLDDLQWFHQRAAAHSAGVPLVLFGHSMGGLIVTTYLLDRAASPDLLVLSSPAIEPVVEEGGRSIDATRLSKDPVVQESYMTDPLVLRERVTEELYYGLIDGLAMLPGRAAEISFPTLLIHGAADAVCSAEGARRYVESFSGGDVTCKLYADGRHEMFNETNRAEVLDDLWAWLDERLPA